MPAFAHIPALLAKRTDSALVIGVGTSIFILGFVFAVWLAIFGVGVLMFGIWGLIFEYYRGKVVEARALLDNAN